jgi:hypothetical protein
MRSADQFDEFEASELFCPTCRTATPVRRRLLLVLPTGNKYDYLCSRCGRSVGDKIDNDREAFDLLRPPGAGR